MLSKLRQYNKDQNLADYLFKEMRQNWRDLELFMKDTLLELSFKTVLFVNNNSESVENNTKTLSLANNVMRSGKITENVYYPLKGRYFVEMFGLYTNTRANNVPLGFIRLIATNSDGVQQSIVSYEIENNLVESTPGPVGFFCDLSPSLGLSFKGVSNSSGLTLSNITIKITKVG